MSFKSKCKRPGWVKTCDGFFDHTTIFGFRYLHSKYRVAFRLVTFILLLLALGMTIYQLYQRILHWWNNPYSTYISFEFLTPVPFPIMVLCNTMQMKISAAYQSVKEDLSKDEHLFNILGITEYHSDFIHFMSSLYENDGRLNEGNIGMLKDLDKILYGLNKSFHEMNYYRRTEIKQAFEHSDRKWVPYYLAWSDRLASFPTIQRMLQELCDANKRNNYHHMNGAQVVRIISTCENTLSCVLLATYKFLNYINSLNINTLLLKTGQLQSDFILSCKWHSSDHCIIEQIVTHDGYCFKITTHGMNSTSKTGPKSGVSVILDVQMYEAFPDIVQSSAVKLYLSSPESNNDFYKQHITAIYKGQYLDLRINSYNTEEKYRSTCGYKNDDKNKHYDRNQCLREHSHKLITNECNCTASGHPIMQADLQENSAEKCVSSSKNCAYFGSDICVSQDLYPALLHKTTSASGASCLNWHEAMDTHPFDTRELQSGQYNHSECRNPDASPAAWCYVNSPLGVIWEYCWDECQVGSCVNKDGCAVYGSEPCTHVHGYQGYKTTAYDGEPCLPWSQAYSGHPYGNHSYCRIHVPLNHDHLGYIGPACFTVQSLRYRNLKPCFEPCLPPLPKATGFVDDTIIPCVEPLDGYDCSYSGSRACTTNQYNGTRNVTIDGQQCVSWKLTVYKGEGDHNYCRNPDGKMRPWCFTAQSAWKYCFAPCPEEGLCVDPIKQCSYGGTARCSSDYAYIGQKNTTVLGFKCQIWNQRYPQNHDMNFNIGDHNYCRNTLGQRPWCFTDANWTNWDYCFEDCEETPCIDEHLYGVQCIIDAEACKLNGSYTGFKDTTRNNKSCIKWNETGMSYIGDHSYCRNPDGKESPWCFVTGGWDYCFDSCPHNKGTCVNEELQCVQMTDEIRCKRDEKALDNSFKGYHKNKTRHGEDCVSWKNLMFMYLNFSQEMRHSDHNNCYYGRMYDSAPSLYSKYTSGYMRYYQPWCVYKDETGEHQWETCYNKCEDCVHEKEYDTCADYGSSPCKHTGYTSFGGKKTTISGKTCKIWNKVGDYKISDNNFCRNPNDRDAPWCYTDDRQSWEYCFADCQQLNYDCVDETKQCAYLNTNACGSSMSYNGTKSVTKSNRRCLPWSSNAVYSYVGSHNYCRNPDGDIGPWCFTEEIGFGYCFDQCQSQDQQLDRCISLEGSTAGCFHLFDSAQCRYLGNEHSKFISADGFKCQDWSSTSPQQIPENFGKELEGQGNSCANPYGVYSLPWCITEEAGFQYCYYMCTDALVQSSVVQESPSQPTITAAPTNANIEIDGYKDQEVFNQHSQDPLEYCSMLQQFNCVNRFLKLTDEETIGFEDDKSICPNNCKECRYSIDQKIQAITQSNYQDQLPAKAQWIAQKRQRLDKLRQRGSRGLLDNKFPIRREIKLLADDINSFGKKLHDLIEHEFDFTCQTAGDFAAASKRIYNDTILDLYNATYKTFVLAIQTDVVSKATDGTGVFSVVQATNSFQTLQHIIKDFKLKLKYHANNDLYLNVLKAALSYLEQIVKCGEFHPWCMQKVFEEFFGENGALKYSAIVMDFLQNYDLPWTLQYRLKPAWTNLLQKAEIATNPKRSGNELLNPMFQTEVDFASIYHGTEAFNDLEQAWNDVYTAYDQVKNESLAIVKKIDQYHEMKTVIKRHLPIGWPFPEPTPDTRDTQNIRTCFQNMWNDYFEDPFVKSNWFVKVESVLEKIMPFTPGLEYDKNNLLAINLYYGELRREYIVQRQAFGVFDLLSDIGGTLGLYLGATMITLFEVIAYFCQVRGININKPPSDDEDDDAKLQDRRQINAVHPVVNPNGMATF